MVVIDNLAKRTADGKTIDIPDFGDVKDGFLEIKGHNILNLTDNEPIFRGIDTVFHLSAKIGGIKYFHKYPATILKANDLLTHKVLTNCVNAGVKRVVYTSSSMVFEQATKFPTPEDHIKECPMPLSAYGYSKLSGEKSCEAYHDEFGIEYVIARPFNAFGPGEIPEDEVGIAHVIPDLIKKAMSGQYPLEILGDGEQTRSYSYVTEVAEGIGKIGMGRYTNQAFNIGTSEESTIKQIAEVVWQTVGRTEPLKFLYLEPYRYDVRRRCPDVSKMKKLYGWGPKIGLSEGVRLTYDYLRGRVNA